MRSEQVYWVFTVTVDQMDKFTPLIPSLWPRQRRTRARCSLSATSGTTGDG